MPRDPTIRIPQAIADRMLAMQPRIREPSPQAREWGVLKRLLNYRAAIVERPVPLSPRDLRFWEIDDDADMEDFLFDKLLRSAPVASDDPAWAAYPQAYVPLLTVLRFEQHRQFDGFTAVGNEGVEGMAPIIAAYRTLGLRDEADALRKATAVLARFADEDEAEEAIEAAYDRCKNSTPGFEERLAVIADHVRANAGGFAAAR